MRHFRLCGLALLSLACGKIEQPKDVEVLKLKPVMSLQAIPGEGLVTLSWTGNNNESDFSGYNIYISDVSPEVIKQDLGLENIDTADTHKLKPLVFKDSADEEIKGLRERLSKYFNWDEASKSNKDLADGKSFAPLARCNVTANDIGGACVAVDDNNMKNRANGLISYTVKGLSAEREYTFFVTASMDKGKKIVSPTSDIIVVAPHKTQTMPAGFQIVSKDENDNTFFGLSFAPGGSANLTTIKTTGVEKFCMPQKQPTATSAAQVYFQFIQSGIAPAQFITGSNGSRIQDLGVVTDAEGEAMRGNLLEAPTRLSGTALIPGLDVPAVVASPEDTDIGAKSGYTACGRSLKLMPHHLYSIALVENGKWRYALLESGSNESDVSGYKIIVGLPDARRL